jgi:hypothetical protein
MTVIKLIAALCGAVASAKTAIACARHLGLI